MSALPHTPEITILVNFVNEAKKAEKNTYREFGILYDLYTKLPQAHEYCERYFHPNSHNFKSIELALFHLKADFASFKTQKSTIRKEGDLLGMKIKILESLPWVQTIVDTFNAIDHSVPSQAMKETPTPRASLSF